MKMKLITTISVILILSNHIYSQNQDELVKSIRKNYVELQSKISTYKKVVTDQAYEQAGCNTSITTYYNGNSIVRMEDSVFCFMDENHMESFQFNFKDGTLFFVFEKEFDDSYAENGEDYYSKLERRIYISDGKIVEVLKKQTHDKNVDLASLKNESDVEFLKSKDKEMQKLLEHYNQLNKAILDKK